MTNANRYDEALRLFEELDGLDDAFIEEGMLPDESAHVTPVRRRMGNRLVRWANSGWGVAMLCVLVSMSLLVAAIHFGIDANHKGAEDAAPPMSPGYDAEEEGDNKWNGDGIVKDEAPAETEETTSPETQG